MVREWFIKNGEAVEGPIGSSELRKRAADGSIQPATPIRLGGEGEWMPAGRVGDLFSPVNNSGAPAGVASEGVTQADPAPAEAPQPRGLLTNTQALILGSALVVSVLIASAAVGLVIWFQSRTETSPANSASLSWATLIEALPDPAVVTNAALREAIIATGLPWRVRDNATQIEMLLVPPGTFDMGCAASNAYLCISHENPVHQVTLTNAFYIGRYEVTQAQWTARTGSNPSFFQSPSAEVPAAQVPNRPVETVSWDTIQGFLSATGLRLPTEAEWEYAYRAGTTTAFHSMPGFLNGTNDDAQVGNIAWFKSNSRNQTRPVGGWAANALGLHDMSGNVEEWVNDWYSGTYYASSPSTNPPGPARGAHRVLRGGSWGVVSYSLRSSCRSDDTPGGAFYSVGFRVARNP
jgi:formylglycine-generating enzyme required for sulfatase activity